ALGQALGAVVSRKAIAVGAAAGFPIDGGSAAYQRAIGGVLLTWLAPLIFRWSTHRETAPSPRWREAWGSMAATPPPAPPSSAALAAAGWTDDYEKALAQAKADKKIVLLDFTGSDWCPWCIKLDKEVYEKPKFKEYAKDNLVLVTVDFPNGKHLTKKVKEQN